MSKVIRLSKITLMLAISMSTGCSFVSDLSIPRECRPWVKSFFHKPLEAQQADLRSFALEDQYRIYLCGNQVIHPPTMYLVESLAQGGKGVADLLKGELSKSNTDATVRDIIMVLREMQRLGTYDVAQDRKLMQLAADSISKMRDKDWRQMANEMLLEIEKDQRATPRGSPRRTSGSCD
jgi:hypothetical protein